MKKNVWVWGCFMLMVWMCSIVSVSAEESATPQEVIQKVKEASEFLAKSGDEGLKEFNDSKGRWVWKDTYVWVLKCAEGTDAAHPFKPALIGKNLIGMKDPSGKLFFAEMCNVVKLEKGGWVEYMWPKVGEKTPSRKISYLLDVPGTPYEVGAGIYNEDISIEELNKMIK